MAPALQRSQDMTDRSIRLIMLAAAALLFIGMSTPLTGRGLGEVASRVVHQLAAPAGHNVVTASD